MKPKSQSGESRKQILDDHRRIGELLSEIASATSPATTAANLEPLLPLLQRHFREEEDEIDGLHADIQQQTPQYSNALQDLKQEHRDLLTEAQQLLDQIGRGEVDAEQARQRGMALKQQLAGHETRETELFVDSIWTDIGGVD